MAQGAGGTNRTRQAALTAIVAKKGGMFRVLLTDASYKHAIALARHAKKEIHDLYIIGHSTYASRLARWQSCFDSVISDLPLERALETQIYDMVIPVGGLSVLTVAALRPDRAILPSRDRLEVCYDKRRTIELARNCNVPVPGSWYVETQDGIDQVGAQVCFPCVVKPSREAANFKGVAYCDDPAQLRSTVLGQLKLLNGGAGVLIQEYVTGCGCGFFALMEHGAPLRIFMHKRIREFPPSGGRSTAARAFHSERLKEYGLRLLSALEWHGVAMVEFKHVAAADDFVLMEINGKFWGSLELALSAGMNFGADLIRMYRGEKLSYRDDYDRDHEFYWPLDDDMLTLWQTRSLGALSDYWKPNAHTNLFQSFRADALKSMRLAKKVLLG